jgi:hypothetical protein
MSTINLLPGELRDRWAVRKRRARWAVGLGAYALAAAGAAGAMALSGGQERWRMDSDEGRAAARVSAAEEALAGVHKQLNEHRRRLIASETVGVHPDWSLLLQALAKARGDEVVLETIELRAEEGPAPTAPAKGARKGEEGKGRAGAGAARPLELEQYRLKLRGFALSQPEVMGFVRRLEEMGPLRDVRLGQTSAAQHRGLPAFAFSVECRLTELAEAARPEEGR